MYLFTALFIFFFRVFRATKEFLNHGWILIHTDFLHFYFFLLPLFLFLFLLLVACNTKRFA